MATINISENCGCNTQNPTTPGVFYVRLFFKNLVDAGHVSGPFHTRESAERFAAIAASRTDVQKALITTTEN